jgi:hypothetical protein
MYDIRGDADYRERELPPSPQRKDEVEERWEALMAGGGGGGGAAGGDGGRQRRRFSRWGPLEGGAAPPPPTTSPGLRMISGYTW